ncbi:MAG: preprotein translocase subunit SecG [Chloroflexota bacterium]
MKIALDIALIIVAIVLILVILMQTKGSSFSGAFSDAGSINRTRRGVEQTLFQFTIAIGVVFILLAMIAGAQGIS